MDVEFDLLSNAVMNIFYGWEPAELFNAKHEKTVAKMTCLKVSKKFFY